MNLKDKIHTIRGKQVMLDRDLAELHGVKTKRLNEQVRRNIERFPEDFCFQLKKDELNYLRSQFATIEVGKGRHTKYLPFVFTQEGVASLSGVLHSDVAIKVNITIMRAFVSMRNSLLQNASIFKRLDRVELKQLEHDKHFDQIFNAIEQKQLTSFQGIFYDGTLYLKYITFRLII
ncbi:MAG: ORF6N domain-containing protein [Candidatus Woesearchaeota archaeon]